MKIVDYQLSCESRREAGQVSDLSRITEECAAGQQLDFTLLVLIAMLRPAHGQTIVIQSKLCRRVKVI